MLFLISGVFLSCFPYSTANFVKENNNLLADSEIKGQSSVVNTSSPELITKDSSYVLLNPQNKQILNEYQGDIKRAPASTTKLLTGLIAVKDLKETELVRVGREVEVEGSRLGLKPGDEISVHDLLTALYVQSANDAAAAIAVKVSGSIPAFAVEMNNYALSLGCLNSNFRNPHGLPEPGHYTTAEDLSKIAGAFLKQANLMKFVKETSAAVRWRDSKGQNHSALLKNTNSLLGVYPGDQGLKTGTTTEAGQCLISYVCRPDGELLLILLGSKQRYSDSIKLLDEGWADQRINAAIRNLSNDQRDFFFSPGLF